MGSKATPDRADVLVVGAGAAGLMASAVAAGRGLEVVLLEKNARPGLKILISGGGRCNLTTTLRGRALEAQYGERRGRWLRHALRSFQPDALRSLVERLGVPLREEDLDKVFPVSGRSRDVLDAFVRHAVAQGVDLVREAPVEGLRAIPGAGFEVVTPRGRYAASRVVLCTGGLSYPKTGATGDGYRFVQELGHTLVPPVPALAPLGLDLPWLNQLQGLVLDARLRLVDVGGRRLVERRRPTLITHRGLSGPAPMDVSGYIEERHGFGCTLCLDLAPERRAEDIDAALIAAGRGGEGRRAVQHLLPAEIPERLRLALAEQAGAQGSVAELRREARRRLVESVKDLRLPVERSLGFGAAEVTRGGVPLDEVDPRTMESRLVPGLFLCGEILDVDGPIGGFNFQAAFATGRLAGLNV